MVERAGTFPRVAYGEGTRAKPILIMKTLKRSLALLFLFASASACDFPELCETDADCGPAGWCGWAADDETRACKAYSFEGGPCLGEVAPSELNRCAPGLSCECTSADCYALTPGVTGTCSVENCTSISDCGSGFYCGPVPYSAGNVCIPGEPAGAICGAEYGDPYIHCATGLECTQNPGLDEVYTGYGVCYDQETTYYCETDDDCFGVAWCGWAENDTDRICKLHGGMGANCGEDESIPPSDRERCSPSLECDLYNGVSGACTWSP